METGFADFEDPYGDYTGNLSSVFTPRKAMICRRRRYVVLLSAISEYSSLALTSVQKGKKRYYESCMLKGKNNKLNYKSLPEVLQQCLTQ